MGLDLYVGTLTRYYTKNWKTSSQQFAEANGFAYEKIEPNVEGQQLAAEEIRKIVTGWRDSVLTAISASIGECPAWEENNEAEYFTVKPDWPAYGALLLYAAAKVYGEPYPTKLYHGWNFDEEPLIQRARKDETLGWSLFKGAEWWLPLEQPLMLGGQNPVGDQIVIASSGALLLELLRINELGWKADEDAVLNWEKTEGYPANATVESGELSEMIEHTAFSTVSLARYAYSQFWQAAKFSLEHKVPIVMDY